MTPDELPAYLEALRARAETAIVAAADRTGSEYTDHLKGVTLQESGSHPPVTRTPAPRGRPPARMTGHLADTVRQEPAYAAGDGIAVTSVAPHAIYAATQQRGAVHTSESGMWLWVRYIGPASVLAHNWVKHEVTIPKRPYMDVAVDEMIADGSLEQAGADGFEAAMWG